MVDGCGLALLCSHSKLLTCTASLTGPSPSGADFAERNMVPPSQQPGVPDDPERICNWKGLMAAKPTLRDSLCAVTGWKAEDIPGR